MVDFERPFRGKIFSSQEGVTETPREEGLENEAATLRARLETDKSLGRRDKERLEARLEEINRDLNPKDGRLRDTRHSSILKGFENE